MSKRRALPAGVNPAAARAAEERYVSSHWGMPLQRVLDHPDPDLPSVLVGMGKLIELHYQHPNKYQPPPYEEGCDDCDAVITFPTGCILAFDNTKTQRLYAILTPEAQAGVCQRYPVGRSAPLLEDVAHSVGARQNRFRGSPVVRVNPIGLVTHVVYRTNKKGDGLSEYIHRFGEEKGPPPLLCSDVKGRLWFAGGSYSVPDEGITD